MIEPASVYSADTLIPHSKPFLLGDRQELNKIVKCDRQNNRLLDPAGVGIHLVLDSEETDVQRALLDLKTEDVQLRVL